MDFLNRAYSQLYDTYRTMTPGARLTAGLLAAVVIVGAGYAFTHQTVSADVDLMHGVPIAVGQVPQMEAAFAKANLKGWEVRGASIYVPRGQEGAYMAALAAANELPPNWGDALNRAISESTPFDGRQVREDRMKIARQTELSRILSSMTGIESAYVLYDIDSKVGFNKDKLITATASIKPVGTAQLDEARVSDIRHNVAGTIAGLKPENVTVSDLNGRTWYGNTEEGEAAEENLYVSLRRTYEQDLKAKILNALCFIPNVTVGASVVLDRDRVKRIKQDKPSPSDERPSKEGVAKSPKRPSHANRPAAVVVQQPNTATVLNALLGRSPNDGGDDDAELEPAETVARDPVKEESVAMAPTVASVSVGVPSSYFKSIWQQRNPAEPGQAAKTPDQASLDRIQMEELTKIQRHVAQLLPQPEGVAKAAEWVTVTPFQDFPAQEPPAPTLGQDVLHWLRQSWGMLGTIAVALVSLLVLRSMVRSTANVQATSPNANPDDVTIGSTPSVVPAPHARRFHGPSPSLREELSEFIEDDPDAAANVLRSWIGNKD